jgi:hypothetical protein
MDRVQRWIARFAAASSGFLSKLKALMTRCAFTFCRWKGNTVINVMRVPVPPDLLRKMTNEERVFFLLMGHAENQISVMFKVLRFAANNDLADQIKQLVVGTQMQIILRIVIGLLYEAWIKLVNDRFLNRVNVNVELTEKGKQVVAELNTHFSESGLLGQIRNAFAFHYPNDEYMNGAFKAAAADEELADHWNWYLSNARTNTCYYVSELVLLHAIMKATKEASLEAAQRKLMEEVNKVYGLLIHLFDEIGHAYMTKYFPNPVPGYRVAAIEDAPNFYEFTLPFYAFVQEADGRAGSSPNSN